MKNKWIAWSLLLLLLLFAGFYVYSTFFRKKRSLPPTEIVTAPTEPKFRHEGNLVIYRNLDKNDTLKTLEIEIVDDEYGITTGLMYRKKMEENRGMLFIFPDVSKRSFWMRNTIIPLDIIFISEQKTIVTIQRNTVPFSEKSIPSTAPAKYVLEVNAGLSDKYGWKDGDSVEWELLK